MSLGPIPWSEVIRYAGWYKLDRDVTEALVDIIREMDNGYMDYNTKEQERINNLNKPKTNKVAK